MTHYDRPPDSPGLRRTLTLPYVVLYGLGVTVGAGIYVLVGEVISRAGDHSPLAFLVAGFVMLAKGKQFFLLQAVNQPTFMRT